MKTVFISFRTVSRFIVSVCIVIGLIVAASQLLIKPVFSKSLIESLIEQHVNQRQPAAIGVLRSKRGVFERGDAPSESPMHGHHQDDDDLFNGNNHGEEGHERSGSESDQRLRYALPPPSVESIRGDLNRIPTQQTHPPHSSPVTASSNHETTIVSTTPESTTKSADKPTTEANDENEEDDGDSDQGSSDQESDFKSLQKADELVSGALNLASRYFKDVMEGGLSPNRQAAASGSHSESNGDEDHEAKEGEEEEEEDEEHEDSERNHHNGTQASIKGQMGLGSEPTLHRAQEAWLDLGRWARKLTEDIIKESLPPLIELTYDISLSPECMSSLLQVVQGLREQKPWAYKFVDSMFRPTSGFFDGTITDFGDFDQCRSINTPMFKGQYCLMVVRPALPPKPKPESRVHWKTPIFNFTNTEIEGTAFEELAVIIAGIYDVPGRLGVCVPSKCSVHDMQEIANLITMHSALLVEAPRYCQMKEDHIHLTAYQIVSISFLIILTALVVVGTITDLRYRQFNNTEKPNPNARGLEAFLLAFSAKINCQKLFRIEYNPNNLSALHGLRVFTILWAIIVHTYAFGCFSPWIYRNLVDMINRTESIQYQLLSNAFVLVDTFFMIGGLTLVYVAYPQMEKQKGKLNIPMYILHRWLRILPMIAGAIFFHSLIPLLMSSPYAPEVDFLYKSCETNWWATLLLISNWWKGTEACLIQGWYISADSQLYIFALVILIPLYWRPKLGLSLVGIFTLIASIVSGLIIYVKDLPPTVIFRYMANFDRMDEFLTKTYYPTFQHLGPYLIGMFVGYVIVKWRNARLNRYIVGLGWIICVGLMVGVLFAPYPWSAGVEHNPYLSALYGGSHRALWAVAMAWLTWACITGRGGIVNSVLCAKALIPISRLGFGMYILQMPLIAMRVANKAKDTQIWTDFEMLSQALANFLWTLILAFICHILCEAPFAALEKLVFGRGNGRSGDRGAVTREDNDKKSKKSVEADDSKQKYIDQGHYQENPLKLQEEMSNDKRSGHDTDSGRSSKSSGSDGQDKKTENTDSGSQTTRSDPSDSSPSPPQSSSSQRRPHIHRIFQANNLKPPSPDSPCLSTPSSPIIMPSSRPSFSRTLSSPASDPALESGTSSQPNPWSRRYQNGMGTMPLSSRLSYPRAGRDTHPSIAGDSTFYSIRL